MSYMSSLILKVKNVIHSFNIYGLEYDQFWHVNVNGIYVLKLSAVFLIQGVAKGCLQLFTWKIIQWLTNNNIQINSVFCVLTTINLFLPHLVHKLGQVYINHMVQILYSTTKILSACSTVDLSIVTFSTLRCCFIYF